MESGPLSAAGFPEFAKKVVPFLHVTTRIADRKYDTLLQEKGFRGFPSLAFMDAEGNVLAEPQGRDVASFDKTLSALERYDDLKKRIDGGEEGLDADMLLVEHALGKVQPGDFETRAGALTKVTDEQKAEIDQILVNNEISTLSAKTRRGDSAALKEAAEGMLKMLDEGKRPSKEIRYAAPFWMTIGRYGQESLDAGLMRKAAEGMKADLPGEARALEIATGYEETAGKIDTHADLKKREEGGEAGLEPSILLLEYELGVVESGTFVERAPALIETATAEVKQKLETTLVEARFRTAFSYGRGPDALAKAGADLAKLMKEEGHAPPAAMARNAWGVLAQYAKGQLDPDLMDFAADGILKEYAGIANAEAFANQLKAEAAKLREDKAKADEDAPAEPDKEDGDG